MLNKKLLSFSLCAGLTTTMLLSGGSLTAFAAEDDWEIIDESELIEPLEIINPKQWDQPQWTQPSYIALFEKYEAQWLKGLENEERNAVRTYTGNDYTSINKYLRSGQTDLAGSGYTKAKMDRTITLIDQAIQKATLQEDITVYRNTGAAEFKEDNAFLQDALNIDLSTLQGEKDFDTYIQKATVLVQKNMNKVNTALAYTSTSLKPGDTAFAQSPIRVEIKIPKETHVPYVDSISKFKGEKELLLPRGSKFQITGASTVQENINGRKQEKLVIQATLVN
ncbi:ADP-ribosyltransferase [Bacillus thuringiensis]|uniref:ADP-ribosyltransferase n=1 Tax=Bacillus thuringiensis TaxID=1428 RepID=UPI003B980315